MAVRSVASIADQAEQDPAFAEKLKSDPAGTLRAAAYTSDPTFYRLAIGGLIAIILIVVVGGFIAELWAVGPKEPKKAVPDGLLALGSTALGGLVGLFVTSPNDK